MDLKPIAKWYGPFSTVIESKLTGCESREKQLEEAIKTGLILMKTKKKKIKNRYKRKQLQFLSIAQYLLMLQS